MRLLLLAALLGTVAFRPPPAPNATDAPAPAVCTPPDYAPADYYAIDLVPTRTLPGLRRAEGRVDVTFTPSPFGVSVAADGRYRYDLHLSTTRLPDPRGGAYTVWITSPDLSHVERLGVLDAEGRLAGKASLNKFIVVVTLEEDAAPRDAWRGPIVMRGLSRSGLMHTMAGHGPFASDPCARYGY